MQVGSSPLSSPDEAIAFAVAAVRGDPGVLQHALESVAMPTYVTDRQGVVTHFNSACIDFAGRTPNAGQDRWCVSWRLYTETGVPVPHEKCPMAAAINNVERVRGVVGIAERPDGTRVLFTPYPTPITDESGAMVGAVNILVEIINCGQIAAIEEQARRCRRLALTLEDEALVQMFNVMADEYEAKVRALAPDRNSPSNGSPSSSPPPSR